MTLEKLNGTHECDVCSKTEDDLFRTYTITICRRCLSEGFPDREVEDIDLDEIYL